VAARQFPPEFESRTIYPLLAKPVTRGTLLLGKYLGAGAASLSALAVSYLAYGVLTGLRQDLWFPAILLQAFVLHAGCVLMVTAVGLLGSLVLTPAANLTIGGIVTVAMLIAGQRLPLLAAEQPAPFGAVLTAVHWIAPHVEFFDLRQRVAHDWPPISWKICLAALAYAVGYAGLCLALAIRVFRRRQL
jgi:ABC-type transport system involved in multi-copper enzyme maturation permease subunit